MGEGACKGTKGWTFKKKTIYPPKVKRRRKTKKPWCLTILMDRRHCQNSMGNIEQLIDPETEWRITTKAFLIVTKNNCSYMDKFCRPKH